MYLTNSHIYILLILVVIFATIFALVGVTLSIIKDAINEMMSFKGDKKDE